MREKQRGRMKLKETSKKLGRKNYDIGDRKAESRSKNDYLVLCQITSSLLRRSINASTLPVAA
jgi:hypothetical protein